MKSTSWWCIPCNRLVTITYIIGDPVPERVCPDCQSKFKEVEKPPVFEYKYKGHKHMRKHEWES